MKIQIESQPPDAVQEFFSSPLSFDQKVTVKKLLIVERILERMKALGMSRSQLATKMEVSPADITTMMFGTNHFTIKTLMRAAEAVEAELEMKIVPSRKPKKQQSASSFSSGSSFTNFAGRVACTPNSFVSCQVGKAEKNRLKSV